MLCPNIITLEKNSDLLGVTSLLEELPREYNLEILNVWLFKYKVVSYNH